MHVKESARRHLASLTAAVNKFFFINKTNRSFEKLHISDNIPILLPLPVVQRHVASRQDISRAPFFE